MKVLLIDTSKREALVALVKDGETVAQRQWQADPKLGVRLLQEITDVLAEGHTDLESIDRIAVHKGPGHFSALRTGIVTATMLAEGVEAELVEVAADSLEEMVQQAKISEVVSIVKPVYESGTTSGER